MVNNVEYKCCFTHRRPGRNQNKIRRLKTGCTVIQIDEPGGYAGDGSLILRCRLNLFQYIQSDLPDRHKFTRAFTLKQIEHGFLRMRQNIFQFILACVAKPFYLFVYFNKPPQYGFLPDNIRIGFNIGRRRYRCDYVADKLQAADLRRDVLFL